MFMSMWYLHKIAIPKTLALICFGLKIELEWWGFTELPLSQIQPFNITTLFINHFYSSVIVQQKKFMLIAMHSYIKFLLCLFFFQTIQKYNPEESKFEEIAKSKINIRHVCICWACRLNDWIFHPYQIFCVFCEYFIIAISCFPLHLHTCTLNAFCHFYILLKMCLAIVLSNQLWNFKTVYFIKCLVSASFIPCIVLWHSMFANFVWIVKPT